MTSKKKLVKRAMKHPELHTPAELSYFERWLKARKERKMREKQQRKIDDVSNNS